MKQMVAAKVEHLWNQGLVLDARAYTVLDHIFMRGLPGSLDSTRTSTTLPSSSSSSTTPPAAPSSPALVPAPSSSALAALRIQLRWRSDAEEAEETRITGLGLLFWASLSNNIAAVHELQGTDSMSKKSEGVVEVEEKEESDMVKIRRFTPPSKSGKVGAKIRRSLASVSPTMLAPDLRSERLRIDRPDLFSVFMNGVTPLHVAAGLAGWPMVEALLDVHGVDPTVTTTRGQDAVHWASFWGEPEVVRRWCGRFPNWDINRKESTGCCALAFAVQFCSGPNKMATVDALIKAGADTTMRTDSGSHIMIQVAANLDADAEFTRYILSLPGARALVNTPIRPQTRTWGARYRIARCFVCLCQDNSSVLLAAVSTWQDQNALGSASRNGNMEVMEVLAKEGGAAPRWTGGRRRKARLKSAQVLTTTDTLRVLGVGRGAELHDSNT